MSTKHKKLYSVRDIEQAKADSEAVTKYFARKSEKRKTVQVRVSARWHTKLKEVAQTEKMVISFLLGEICKHFFSNYQR